MQAELYTQLPVVRGNTETAMSWNDSKLTIGGQRVRKGTPVDIDISKDITTENMFVPLRLQVLAGVSGWSTESADLKSVEYRYSCNPRNTSACKSKKLLQYDVVYRRSYFVRFFAVLIVALMWIMSLYLVVLAVDHVLFRPRSLEPDTVGYSVGMLFALPTLRMLLEAPLGAYIDMLGFTWCMALTAVAVIIFFSGAYTDHDHSARVFQKVDTPQVVTIKGMPEDGLHKLLAHLDSMDPAELTSLRKRSAAAASAATAAAAAAKPASGASSPDVIIHCNREDTARQLPKPQGAGAQHVWMH